MARGVRLPRTAGRPPRFLRTGHRRATSLSEAHLQAAQRDAGHTLAREAEGVLQSLLFDRASRGLRAQRATFRVLAEGDPDADAALASAVRCQPPPRSLTPPRPPLSDQRGHAAGGCDAAEIVRKRPPRPCRQCWSTGNPGRPKPRRAPRSLGTSKLLNRGRLDLAAGRLGNEEPDDATSDRRPADMIIVATCLGSSVAPCTRSSLHRC